MLIMLYIYICCDRGKNRETMLSSLKACFVKYKYNITAFNKDFRGFQDRIVKRDVVFL